MQLSMARLCFAFLFFLSFLSYAQVKVYSGFEGGNGVLKEYDAQENRVEVQPEYRAGDTLVSWSYCKISGFRLGKPLTIRVWYHQSTQLHDAHGVFSYDKKKWFRIPGKSRFGKYPHKGFRDYTFKFLKNSVYFATGFPYTFTDLKTYLKPIAKRACVDTSTLAVSEAGISIPLLTIRQPGQAGLKDKKELLWIVGRQHAFETPSSYFVEGLVDFLSGFEPEAISMRKKVVTKVVPMVDVDQVIAGGTGKNQLPVDINRDYNANPRWKATKALMDAIQISAKQYTYKAFLDVHAPFPGDAGEDGFYQSHFYYNYPADSNGSLNGLIRNFSNAEGYLPGIIFHENPTGKPVPCLDLWHLEGGPKPWKDDLAFALTWEQAWNQHPDGGFWDEELIREAGANFGRALSAWFEGKEIPGGTVEAPLEYEEEEVLPAKRKRGYKAKSKYRSKYARPIKKKAGKKASKKRRRR